MAGSGGSRGGNPDASGPDSATLYYVHFKNGNQLGVKEGKYPILIGGWRWGTVSGNITERDTRLVVKCSGWIPTKDWAGQLPPYVKRGHKYGRNCHMGCQPEFHLFPVTHAKFWKGIKELLLRIRDCFDNGGSVLFHCNRGEVHAPLTVAIALSHALAINPDDLIPHYTHVKGIRTKPIQNNKTGLRMPRNTTW